MTKLKSRILLYFCYNIIYHRNEINSFKPPLCTYGLNWARRTSWGWLDEWEETALHTQDWKFEPWRSEVEHATSRLRRFPTILNLYEWAGEETFCFIEIEGQSRARTRDLQLYKQAALTTAPGPTMAYITDKKCRPLFRKCRPLFRKCRPLLIYCKRTDNRHL